MNLPLNNLTPSQIHTLKEAERAAAIVKTWPLWKQNLLVNSLKPTTTPREPVKR